MLRSALCVLRQPTDCASAGGFLQILRWRRKPRWIPTAKSKLFRVPERKAEDPIERSELMRLHANYKTQLRAVRGYLMTEANEREATSTTDHLIISPEEMEEEFRKCSELNDKWNNDIAQVRNQRLQKERERDHELILQRLAAKQERVALRRTSVEELVRIEKERVKTLITPDNIDQAIEQALANTQDYNFAIDLGGNIHRDEQTADKK